MATFSKSVSALRSSAIRDLMSLASRPDIISFAGGMPANDLFPVKEVEELFMQLDDKTKRAAFQYGPTEGLPMLQESLTGWLEEKGLPVKSNRLLITTGSQQALNLLAKAFIDPGDRVLTEYPCFIGAIAAFRAAGADVRSIPLDSEGIDIRTLREETQRTPAPKFLYATPYFHNPAGILYSEKRKLELIKLLQGTAIPLIEDDAYGDLWFHEEDRARLMPIKAINPDGVDVCYTGSFSKILGPGLRLGWLLAPEPIYEKCELLKQSADACSPSFTQVIADAAIRSGMMGGYVETVRKAYLERAALMTAALRQHLPDYVGWSEPRGGFYIWLTLPEEINAADVLKKAIEAGAVFVTGSTFDPEGTRMNAMRLSYCNNSPEEIERGIPLIAKAIRDCCR
ncbi:PLP-dependent aminotransferase family protein [Pelodictyon luteolum]|uniref:Aminotransferase, class I n=1 Tax=Chlorobium luteolum (strain DSM 273 / BCRC 81028 / 2530) TaxID=319225 RepID=Q3B6S7_CHLL3|nr:PLP-dependent aminotransferase family protein [Pelodictyon luteolum]ABB22954.1 aminotransferase, class I [Pelodictyon luteolum DSM 273]